MANGEMIRITSRDGFELDAYSVQPTGPRKGGVILIQEIFGLSDHIKAMSERFAAAGYEVLAPSMFDRARPGYIVQPADVKDHLEEGGTLARENGPQNALSDIGACFDLLAKSGKVCITGFCYGGTMSWLASAQIPGLAAASCYYGGNIPDMADMKPNNPVICHFGKKDVWIPKEKVDAFAARHPDVPVYWYEADHGFARKGSYSYDEAADALAFERTVELFDANVS
ncbi:MAG: dienelactone hydrolase family protein [Hyphomonadaceae bacterium]